MSAHILKLVKLVNQTVLNTAATLNIQAASMLNKQRIESVQNLLYNLRYHDKNSWVYKYWDSVARRIKGNVNRSNNF